MITANTLITRLLEAHTSSITLKPIEVPSLGDEGGVYKSFHIMHADHGKIGELDGVKDGDHFHIKWLDFKGHPKFGNHEPTLVMAGLRELRKNMPDLKSISGRRITGANQSKKNGGVTTVILPRR